MKRPPVTCSASAETSLRLQRRDCGTYQAPDKAPTSIFCSAPKGVEYPNLRHRPVIQVLMEANKSGQSIAICGLTPHFTKVFTMVGITKYAALYADEAAALSAL